MYKVLAACPPELKMLGLGFLLLGVGKFLGLQ
jgi:hypothetical protein